MYGRWRMNLHGTKMDNLDRFLKEFRGDVFRNVPLKEHTSLRIGGPADYLLVPDDTLALKMLIDLLAEIEMEYMIIGGGTNILVKDGGVRGCVISLKRFQKLETVQEGDDTVTLFVQTGAPLQRLINHCKDSGLTGLEGLAGIPGTMGGALFGNAGAFGYEIMDVVQRVTVLERGALKVYERGQLNPGYREGGFPKETIILGVHVRLERDDPQAVKTTTEAYLKEKKATQPIGQRSAGCVFKNPESLPAGKLIDEAGCKGMRVGDIEVSTVHANFFVNTGEGRAEDFLMLMDMVSERVYDVFGIVLEPEIRIVGQKE